MKTVVYIMAAVVLLIISLGNLSHKPVTSEPVSCTASGEYVTIPEDNDANSIEESSSIEVINLSGKNVNFFIASY